MSVRYLILLLLAIKVMLTRASIKKNEIHGVHLKLAAFTVAPFNVVNSKPNGNLTHTGSTQHVFEWLSERLNFTFSFILIDDEGIVKHGPGTSQIIRMIENNDIDGSGVAMIITPDRKDRMDFAYLIWTEPYKILSPRPEEEPRLFAFVWPFQKVVWLLILVAMLIMVIFMVLFTKLYTSSFDLISRKTNSSKPISQSIAKTYDSIGVYALFVTNTMTNQGGKDPVDRFSFRLLIGAWLLVAMVLVNSYSGTVISFLTVPRMKPPINTLEDLATSRDVQLILYQDIVITRQIMEAKSGVLKTLGDMARLDPNIIVPDMASVTILLQKGKYGFPYLATFCKFFVVNQFKKEGQCRFQTSEPLPLFGFWSFPLQKHSKYTSKFNLALMEAWQFGLPPLWVKNAVPPEPKCFAKVKPQSELTREKPILLKDMFGIFLVLGIGVSFSVVAFFMEIIYAKCQLRKTQCNT